MALFAALVFTGNLFVTPLFLRVVWAFIIFCIAASATYLFNDVLDVKSDQLHPIKKNRPVASGKLPVKMALLISISFALVSFILAYNFSYIFFLLIVIYLVLQLMYSLWLKNHPTIDILIIAMGFIIRVYAGAFVINAHLSVWFLLCVVSVALFLASGKRRAELSILDKSTTVTRKSLVLYKRELLNSYVTMFGNAAWLSWALFTFFESPRATTPVWIFLAELSMTTAINKLLMITIPIVIYIIMRYEGLIFEGKSETPEKLLLSDRGLIVSIAIWFILIVYVLYGGISVV